MPSFPFCLLANSEFQVRQLRRLLPDKLIEPTRSARQAPPEKVAMQLRSAATTGSNQIKDFKKAYHSEDMRSLFQAANTADVPQGYDVWTVDYIDLLPTIKSAKAPTVTQAAEEEPIGTIIEKFREQHLDVKLEIDESPEQLPIDVTGQWLSFRVKAGPAKGRYEITTKEGDATDAIRKSIVQYLNTNHSGDGLHDLLTLLVSYDKVKSTPCQKCHELLDPGFDLPLARIRTDSKDDNEPKWNTLHASCV
jgi:hypothetical protein